MSCTPDICLNFFMKREKGRGRSSLERGGANGPTRRRVDRSCDPKHTERVISMVESLGAWVYNSSSRGGITVWIRLRIRRKRQVAPLSR